MAEAWLKIWLIAVGYVWGAGEIGWALAMALLGAGLAGREILIWGFAFEEAMRRKERAERTR